MSRLSIPATAVAVAAALWAAPALAVPQEHTPPGKYAGQWRLNQDLSSHPPAEMGAPQDSPEGGSGRRGGGYGGRGGRGGGQNQKQMLETRALMREAFQAPALVTIIATPDVVSFTDDQGMVSKYVTDGKKQKVTLGGADIEATTSWDINALTQELKAGSLKVKRTWQVSDQGNQMVLEVAAEGNRGGGSGQMGPGDRTLRFVYDRVNQAGR